MFSVSQAWGSLGHSERILGVLFGVGFILGFLLTPLGFETRMNELRTLAFAVFFVTVGLLLLPLAGILAVVDASLLFLTTPADLALFLFTVPPPPAVTAGEFLLILVGIGYMLYGPQVYDRDRSR